MYSVFDAVGSLVPVLANRSRCGRAPCAMSASQREVAKKSR